MSTTLRLMFISLLLMVFCITGLSQTVYIVRHAEKDLSSNNPKDPSLNVAGLDRSYALRDKMKKTPLKAIFSTNYKRTIETAEAVAKDKALKIQIYNPQNLDSIANVIKQQYKGKTVLMIGHSNTILETVKALGGVTNKNRIEDQEYSNMFIVHIAKHGKVKTKSMVYGK